MRRALDGMKNEQRFIEGKKRYVRVASDRAHYFRAMFEMKAEGKDEQIIVDRLNAIGFRTQTSHRWDRSDPKHLGLSAKVVETFLRSNNSKDTFNTRSIGYHL